MARVWVKPYTKADGTQVKGFYRKNKYASKGEVAMAVENLKIEKRYNDVKYRKVMRGVKNSSAHGIPWGSKYQMEGRQSPSRVRYTYKSQNSVFSHRFNNKLTSPAILKRRAKLK